MAPKTSKKTADVVEPEVTETAAEPVEVEATDEVVEEPKLAGAPVEPVVEAPVLDTQGLLYGIICTECGRFTADPMGELIVARCSTCGGKITRGMQRDVKEIVNSTRASRGLSPLF